MGAERQYTPGEAQCVLIITLSWSLQKYENYLMEKGRKMFSVRRALIYPIFIPVLSKHFP